MYIPHHQMVIKKQYLNKFKNQQNTSNNKQLVRLHKNTLI